ncbi:hypothetical protein IWW42_004847 [Coemansia sp. RSA 1085]|nr:hypothetical protein BX667DRAFT_506019 [Coemansia mojavensis]KAJ2669007.1 hypothetical protein IWW42_004847 [Coemansia sp. RSA 1085]
MEGPENELDKSILQLIDQIKARREQAVQFAQQVERSIYQTETCGFIGQGAGGSDILDSISETSHSGSPPESFLEGFTRNFIDTYKAPPNKRGFGQWQGREMGDMHRPQRLRQSEEAVEPHVHTDGRSAVQSYVIEEASEHTESVCSGSPQPEAPKGITTIDLEARAQMWQRANAAATKADEARIQSILKMAERISRTASPKSNIVAEKTETTENVELWGPKEWEQWADFVRTSNKDHLEWVHDQQNAWQHGFTDTWLPNGKLQRTYRGLGLTLQAYPDGNVKRTANTAKGIATTLYFANGDWSCVVDKASYYYYCDERVWHEQTGSRNVYRYPDGREEHVALNE